MQSFQTSSTFSTSNSWSKALHLTVKEHSYQPLRVEGNLPLDLQGTLYRNGPGVLESFGKRARHLFDPEGVISAIRMKKGQALGALRSIRTEKTIQEQKAGKALFRTFSQQGAGLRRFGSSLGKNPGNTNVLWWQNQLFALNEGGFPIRINPDDLSTQEETNLAGMVVQGFSAHPHGQVNSDIVYNIGLTYGKITELSLFALPTRGSATTVTTLQLPFSTLVHDFIVTQNYAVFFISPIVVSLPKYLFGNSIYDSLSWKAEQGTEIIVIPLKSPHQAIRFSTDTFFQWHFANAFEQGSDEIIVDYIRYPNMNTCHSFESIMKDSLGDGFDGTYHRASLSLGKKHMRSEQLWDGICEFPRVAPSVEGVNQQYTYVASHSNKMAAKTMVQNQLTRLDVQTGEVAHFTLEDGQYPSEPIFVPAASHHHEADGYLLSLIYDGNRDQSFVGIWDAKTPSAPMLAKIDWEQPLPFTFHGVFVPEMSEASL